ncbi:hypothetical protein ACFQ9X_24750 [Catenulispora yoronensis]
MISVPGAPPSSFATGSQPEVLKPGAEICAPLWVAVVLVTTFQPPAAPSVVSAVEPLWEPADDAWTDAASASAWTGATDAGTPDAVTLLVAVVARTGPAEAAATEASPRAAVAASAPADVRIRVRMSHLPFR